MKNDRNEPAAGSMEDAQKLFRQPTAAEMSLLTYGQLRDLRVSIQQEARNDFAHLLNRGSWLE